MWQWAASTHFCCSASTTHTWLHAWGTVRRTGADQRLPKFTFQSVLARASSSDELLLQRCGEQWRSVLQCNALYNYNVLFCSQSHNDCSSCNRIVMFFFIAVRRYSQHLPGTLQDWSSWVSRPIVAVGFWRAISDAWRCCVFHHSWRVVSQKSALHAVCVFISSRFRSF